MLPNNFALKAAFINASIIFTPVLALDIASAQQIILDKEITFPCLGSQMTNYRVTVDCPVSAVQRGEYIKIFSEESQENTDDMQNLCVSRNQTVPQRLILSVQKYIDLYNQISRRQRQSYIECNFTALFSNSRQDHIVVKKIEALLDNPYNPLDDVDAEFNKDDLKAILHFLPVKEKYKDVKDAFEDKLVDNDKGLKDDVGTGLRGLAGEKLQDKAEPFEDAASLVVKLQIAGTPGATPNSQDLQTLWMLQKGFPAMIKNAFSGALK